MTATRIPGESGTGAPTKGRIARLRGPLLYGALASLLSVTGYGTSQVIARNLLTGDTPPQVGSAVTLFVGMLVLGGMSARNMKKDIRAPKRAIAWIMLAGILASTGAYLSFIALSLAPIVLVSPFVAVSPLVTLILAAIFLRQVEKITMRTVLGACLVVSGVILVIVGNS